MKSRCLYSMLFLLNCALRMLNRFTRIHFLLLTFFQYLTFTEKRKFGKQKIYRLKLSPEVKVTFSSNYIFFFGHRPDANNVSLAYFSLR